MAEGLTNEVYEALIQLKVSEVTGLENLNALEAKLKETDSTAKQLQATLRSLSQIKISVQTAGLEKAVATIQEAFKAVTTVPSTVATPVATVKEKVAKVAQDTSKSLSEALALALNPMKAVEEAYDMLAVRAKEIAPRLTQESIKELDVLATKLKKPLFSTILQQAEKEVEEITKPKGGAVLPTWGGQIYPTEFLASMALQRDLTLAQIRESLFQQYKTGLTNLQKTLADPKQLGLLTQQMEEALTATVFKGEGALASYAHTHEWSKAFYEKISKEFVNVSDKIISLWAMQNEGEVPSTVKQSQQAVRSFFANIAKLPKALDEQIEAQQQQIVELTAKGTKGKDLEKAEAALDQLKALKDSIGDSVRKYGTNLNEYLGNLLKNFNQAVKASYSYALAGNKAKLIADLGYAFTLPKEARYTYQTPYEYIPGMRIYPESLPGFPRWAEPLLLSSQDIRRLTEKGIPIYYEQKPTPIVPGGKEYYLFGTSTSEMVREFKPPNYVWDKLIAQQTQWWKQWFETNWQQILTGEAKVALYTPSLATMTKEARQASLQAIRNAYAMQWGTTPARVQYEALTALGRPIPRDTMQEIEKESGLRRTFSTTLEYMRQWFLAGTFYFAPINALKQFLDLMKQVAESQRQISMAVGPEKAGQVWQASIHMAQTYGVSVEDAKNAVMEWVKETQNLNEAMTLANTTTEASVVTNENVLTLTQKLIPVYRQFGATQKDIKDWAEAFSYIYSHFPNVDISNMLEGMSKASSLAKDLGLSMQELAVLMAHAVSADPRFGFFGLTSSFQTLAKELAKIYTEGKDSQIIRILREMGAEPGKEGWLTKFLEGVSGLSPEDQAMLSSRLASFGGNFWAYIMSKGKEAAQMLKEMGNYEAEYYEKLASHSLSYTAAVNRLNASKIALATNIGTTVIPALNSFLGIIDGLIQSLSNINPLLTGLPLILGGVPLAISGIKWFLTPLIREFGPQTSKILSQFLAGAGGIKGLATPIALTLGLRFALDYSGLNAEIVKAFGPEAINFENKLFSSLMLGDLLRRILVGAKNAFGDKVTVTKATEGIALIIPLLISFAPQIGAAIGKAIGGEKGAEVGQQVASTFSNVLTSVFIWSILKNAFAGLGTVGKVVGGPWGAVFSVVVPIAIEFAPKIIGWAKSEILGENKPLTPEGQKLAEQYKEMLQKPFGGDIYALSARPNTQVADKISEANKEIAKTADDAKAEIDKLISSLDILSTVLGALPDQFDAILIKLGILGDTIGKVRVDLNLYPDLQNWKPQISYLTGTTQQGFLYPLSKEYTEITGHYLEGINEPGGWAGTGKPHMGMDIAAPENALVVSSVTGEVLMVGKNDPQYGNYIEVYDPNTQTAFLYAHLSGFTKEYTKGQKVIQGEQLGFVGATGNATGPHLHIETKRWEENRWVNINPEAVFGDIFQGAKTTPEQWQQFAQYVTSLTDETEKQQLVSAINQASEYNKELLNVFQQYREADWATLKSNVEIVEQQIEQQKTLAEMTEDSAQKEQYNQNQINLLYQKKGLILAELDKKNQEIAELQDKINQGSKDPSIVTQLAEAKSEAEGFRTELVNIDSEIQQLSKNAQTGLDFDTLMARFEATLSLIDFQMKYASIGRNLSTTETVSFDTKKLEVLHQEYDAIVQEQAKQINNAEKYNELEQKRLDVLLQIRELEVEIAQTQQKQFPYYNQPDMQRALELQKLWQGVPQQEKMTQLKYYQQLAQSLGLADLDKEIRGKMVAVLEEELKDVEDQLSLYTKNWAANGQKYLDLLQQEYDLKLQIAQLKYEDFFEAVKALNQYTLDYTDSLSSLAEKYKSVTMIIQQAVESLPDTTYQFGEKFSKILNEYMYPYFIELSTKYGPTGRATSKGRKVTEKEAEEWNLSPWTIIPGVSPIEAQAQADTMRTKWEETNKNIMKELLGEVNYQIYQNLIDAGLQDQADWFVNMLIGASQNDQEWQKLKAMGFQGERLEDPEKLAQIMNPQVKQLSDALANAVEKIQMKVNIQTNVDIYNFITAMGASVSVANQANVTLNKALTSISSSHPGGGKAINMTR